MEKVKQVIVFRKDLKVRKGKAMAQAAHATMKVFLDACKKESNEKYKTYKFDYVEGSEWDLWLNGIFTKIVVGCNDEKELDELYLKAQLTHLPCSMIIDSGLTEFNNIPTKTCIAIGPAKSDDIDKVTKNLKLL